MEMIGNDEKWEKRRNDGFVKENGIFFLAFGGDSWGLG